MKIMLTALNAKYIHSNLALYDLMAYALPFREHIILKEFTINQPQDELLQDIFKEKPDVICFSCYLWNIDEILSLSEDIHIILPDTDIWYGGPEVSYHPETMMKKASFLKGIMVGEGEKTFYDLCNYYVNHPSTSSLHTIKSIVFRDGNTFLSTPLREPFDLDKLPFCYEALPELSMEHRIIYYESSRGCPFNCSYCLSSIDKKVRYRSLDLVFHDLQFFVDHKVPQVKFVDRTFNCDHKRTLALWTWMKEHDNGITNFHCEIAGELLNEEELKLLNTLRPGLVQLEIGVQTTNEETLKEIHRPSDYVNLKAITDRILQSHNVHRHLDLIAGLPYEDFASFRRSYNMVYAMAPDQLQLGFLKILKGSYMELHQKEYELVAKSHAPFEVLKTKWLSYEDVLELKKVEEMTEVYYNSGQFTMTLPYLLAQAETPFDFFWNLGKFYEEKGYDRISHNRIRRYEILREFAGPSKELDERITYDLYLRENLKKRTDWMQDTSSLKKIFWEIRQELAIQKNSLTHLEYFETLSDQPEIILFDYRSRDPLDHNALITKINHETVSLSDIPARR
jgi:radical SAM superfamily enzyme YgiQ (UPF0313 family)